MNSTKFKVGDKVYFPQYGNIIYTLVFCHDKDYPLKINSLSTTFNLSGHLTKSGKNPPIFHATDENCELLSKLYNTGFEKPKKVLKGSELTRYLLYKGNSVLCSVSDSSEYNAIFTLPAFFLVDSITSDGFFMTDRKVKWKYAVPYQIIENNEKMNPLVMESF
jgi:hypothetical protein